MSVYRVPGSKRYKADSAGFQELGQSSWMSDRCMDAARSMAAQANASGHGSYEAVPRVVQAGQPLQPRAGAAVVETERNWQDVRNRVLVNVARGMGRRSA